VLVDTHCHLHLLEQPPEQVVAEARAEGVGHLVHVGIDLDSSRQAAANAARLEHVSATAGVHPHDAVTLDDRVLGELRALLADERVVAAGETGLDYYRDYAPHDAQRQLFQRHLAIAEELGKAVVIHCRAADADVARALADFDGTVVLHCFSSPGLLEPALERGYYVSFAGNVTYPNAGELRAAARTVPADRILAETDSPYLSPQPRRGRPNEPANVVHTVASLAETRGEEQEELAARIDENASRAFGLQ
jgi:TatD DNase family protein